AGVGWCEVPREPSWDEEEPVDGGVEGDQPVALSREVTRGAPVSCSEASLGFHEGSLPGLEEERRAGVRGACAGESVPGAEAIAECFGGELRPVAWESGHQAPEEA